MVQMKEIQQCPLRVTSLAFIQQHSYSIPLCHKLAYHKCTLTRSFSTGASLLAVKVQHPAPNFKGPAVVNGEFKDIQLSDFKGKYLVLFFYPLDFTFVCPTELIAFSDNMKKFDSIGTAVVGVSTDSHFSHLAWINLPRKQGGLGGLNYPLLADFNKAIARDYDVLVEDAGIALRGLFIIDPKGIVRQITINDLPVGRSVEETLRLVKAFQYTDKHGEVCPANWNPESNPETIKPTPSKSKEYFEKSSTIRYCCVGPAPFDDIGDIPYHVGATIGTVTNDSGSNLKSPEHLPPLTVWVNPGEPMTCRKDVTVARPKGTQFSGSPERFEEGDMKSGCFPACQQSAKANLCLSSSRGSRGQEIVPSYPTSRKRNDTFTDEKPRSEGRDDVNVQHSNTCNHHCVNDKLDNIRDLGADRVQHAVTRLSPPGGTIRPDDVQDVQDSIEFERPRSEQGVPHRTNSGVWAKMTTCNYPGGPGKYPQFHSLDNLSPVRPFGPPKNAWLDERSAESSQ